MDECAICLNEIPAIDKCINDCGHSFCKSCIDTWFDRGKNDCPICRHPIIYFNHNSDHYRIIIKKQQSPRANNGAQTINPQGPYRPGTNSRTNRPNTNANQEEQATNNRLYINRGTFNAFKISMLFVSILVSLQGYLIYHLKIKYSNLIDRHNLCIHDTADLTNLIDVNHLIDTNEQDEVYMYDKAMYNLVQCLLPKYFIDLCFS